MNTIVWYALMASRVSSFFFKRIALYIIMEHVMRERIYTSTSTVFGSAIPQIVLH